MRKIIVISDITIDGVVQSPGALDEDSSGGFKYGGWIAPYLDEATNKAMEKQMGAADYLLGKKTFDIFANYWPHHADYWPGINEGSKYVISETEETSDWKNTVFLHSIDDIKKLKKSEGSDIQVWGSSNLVQQLLTNDLVDELWLKIYPVILGAGKKLFTDSILPAAFTLTESMTTPTGVIMATYKRTGEVKTKTVEV
jgi:dihydrofolate reductase